VNYLQFLAQWYNWPFIAGLLVGVASLLNVPQLERTGEVLGARLGIHKASGRSILRVFAFTFSVVGLTLSGAVHDYWPVYQDRGFVPVLILTTLFAVLSTRMLGRLFERHFPRFRAVGWGSPHLSGREGRVVSRMVSPDYRAGRAQLMDDDTLHYVMCKTADGEIPYGASVRLGAYDEEDGRYYVVEAGEPAEGPGDGENQAGDSEGAL
jgi:hypothetical protein